MLIQFLFSAIYCTALSAKSTFQLRLKIAAALEGHIVQPEAGECRPLNKFDTWRQEPKLTLGPSTPILNPPQKKKERLTLKGGYHRGRIWHWAMARRDIYKYKYTHIYIYYQFYNILSALHCPGSGVWSGVVIRSSAARSAFWSKLLSHSMALAREDFHPKKKNNDNRIRLDGVSLPTMFFVAKQNAIFELSQLQQDLLSSYLCIFFSMQTNFMGIYFLPPKRTIL